MERTGKWGSRYAKYSVTSLAIMSALLAVSPTEVRAEEVGEAGAELNETPAVLAETTQADLTVEEEEALARGEDIVETEAAIEEQVEVVEEAEEAVNLAEETVDETAAELAEVEAEIENVEQEINELEEDAGNVDELEEAIEEDEELASDLETEIAETETTQEELETEVAELEEEVATIEESVAAEEETLADLQEEREQLAEDSSVAPVVENEIVLPDGYIDALKSYSENSNPTDADNEAVDEVAQPGVALNQYESQAEDQAIEIADPTNLDNETAIELAQYTAALLNPIRAAFGNDLLYPNQSAIDMANAIANTYERDNFNAFEESYHHVEGIEEVAGEYGLAQGQFYENLGITSWDFGTTLDDLKERIYDTIVLMLFDDASSYQGHALSLAGEMNSGAAGFLGVSFSDAPAQTGNFDAYHTHFITVPDTSAYLQDSTAFDVTANYPYETVEHSDEIAELDRQIANQQVVLETEQNRLADRQEALAISLENLNETEDQLVALYDELAAVHTRLAEQQTRLEELEDVDALIAEREENLVILEAERDALSEVYASAEAALEAAQTALADEQDRLTELQDELAELKQAPYSFEEERTEEVAFETEIVYNPDLLEGTEEVSQEGVDGVLWLLEHVVYLEDELIDRFVVSSEYVVEPISQIVQVGTRAAEDEDIATPNEPEESFAFDELEQRLAELEEEVHAIESVNEELAAERDALRAILARLQAELEAGERTIEELEQSIAELEARVAGLEEEVAEAPETPEAPAEPAELGEAEDITDSGDDEVAAEADTTSPEVAVVTVEAAEIGQGNDLPETGTASSMPSILVGVTSILSGLGLSIRPKSKRK